MLIRALTLCGQNHTIGLSDSPNTQPRRIRSTLEKRDFNVAQASAETLAAFVRGLRLSDVPSEVVEKVKIHTLDQVGAALVGAELPWNLPVRRYSLEYGRAAKSTVIGSGGEKIDAEFAAMANATAGHGCEIDDYHEGTGHPGCVAVTSSLAMAEEQSASGAEYLLASIIAFEIISRVGVAATASALIDRGFHNVSIFGVFGAAATAAHLLKLGQDQFVAALSIAASHASGLHEYTQTGGEVKRLHAGIGAAGGIRSARLAAFGMTGPRTALEGRRGFLQAFSAHPKPELLTQDLGSTWALMGCRIKPYSCCGIMFQHIDALRAILDEHPLRADEIKDIWAGVDRLSFRIINTIGPEPADMTGAQFSIQFTLAMTVTKGSNDFSEYVDAARKNFRDPAIVDLAKRVRVDLDAECDAVFPEDWLGKIAVTTKDGRVFEAKAYGKRPVTNEEIETKFQGLARQVVAPDVVTTLMDRVRNVEKLGSIRELTALLRTSETRLM